MQDLIERLEKATWPDRDLGNEILLAAGWMQDEIDYGGGNRVTVWLAPDDTEYHDGDQPDPMKSIDAALTLVPEGLMFAVAGPWVYSDSHEQAGQQIYEVALTSDFSDVLVDDLTNSEPDDDYHMGKGCTPAIALCIAALRAQQAM